VRGEGGVGLGGASRVWEYYVSAPSLFSFVYGVGEVIPIVFCLLVVEMCMSGLYMYNYVYMRSKRSVSIRLDK